MHPPLTINILMVTIKLIGVFFVSDNREVMVVRGYMWCDGKQTDNVYGGAS